MTDPTRRPSTDEGTAPPARPDPLRVAAQRVMDEIVAHRNSGRVTWPSSLTAARKSLSAALRASGEGTAPSAGVPPRRPEPDERMQELVAELRRTADEVDATPARGHASAVMGDVAIRLRTISSDLLRAQRPGITRQQLWHAIADADPEGRGSVLNHLGGDGVTWAADAVWALLADSTTPEPAPSNAAADMHRRITDHPIAYATSVSAACADCDWTWPGATPPAPETQTVGRCVDDECWAYGQPLTSHRHTDDRRGQEEARDG